MDAKVESFENDNDGNREPKRFGNYEIVRPIGKGKFAIVYRAKRLDNDEIVALKRINVDSIDAKARDKCLKEINLLQSLDHPNIIKYLDSFITDNDLVIVVEWAAAGDLKRQLRKAQEKGIGFEERIIWKYFSQIADAMQHMHEKRVMHRDLKPANIFLTLDGTIKVGDLGLSRELSEHTIQAHSKVGTPLYMSPEVLRGDGYDFKSDIWSLGCLLYELAMLKSPFKAEGLNLFSLFQKISQGDFQPLPDNYSEELRSLAYSMISIKSDDRPDIGRICDEARRLRAHHQDKYLKSKKSSSSNGVERGDDIRAMRSDSMDSAAAMAMAMTRRLSNDTIEERDDFQQRNQQNGGNTAEANASDESMATVQVTRNPNVRSIADRDDSPGNRIRKPRNIDADADGYDDRNNKNEDVQHKTTNFRQQKDRSLASKYDVNDNKSQSNSIQNGSSHKDRGSRNDDNRNNNSNGNSNSNSERKSEYNRTFEVAPEDTNIDLFSGNQPTARVSQGSHPSSQVYHRAKPKDVTSQSVISSGSKADQEKRRRSGGSLATPTIPMVRDEQTLSKVSAMTALLPLMDNILARLLVLGYPAEKYSQLTPFHFAVDLSVLGSISMKAARASNATTCTARSTLVTYNQQMQYCQFVEMAIWLLQLFGTSGLSSTSTIDVDNDAPLTVSKQLLLVAQNVAGVLASDLTEIYPTSLITGQGEKVCRFLLLIADRAIEHTRFKFKPLVYGKDPNDIMIDVDDQKDEDEEVIDEDEDDYHSRLDRGADEPGGEEESVSDLKMSSDLYGSGNLLAGSMIMPTIDPNRWREEVERVSGILTSHSQKMKMFNQFTEWGNRVDFVSSQTRAWRRHSNNKKNSNDNNNNSSVNKNDRNVEIDFDAQTGNRSRNASALQDDNLFASLMENLRFVATDTKTELDGIVRSETLLNAKSNIVALSSEYAVQNKEYEESKRNIVNVESKIAVLQPVLSDVEDKIASIMETLQSKGRSHGDGSSDGDGNSTVLRLKEGIANLKAEVATISMNCELVSMQLLQARLAHSRLQSEKRAREKRRRKLVGSKRATAVDSDEFSDE